MKWWSVSTKLRWHSCALALILASAAASGYDGKVHQKLTFIAAKQFNRCVARSEVPMLTPLQVRYIAKSNVSQADANLFVRMFRWRYYDRDAEAERSMLWLIDTRFHQHFNDVLGRLGRADNSPELYSNLGRVIGYVQTVSSPPHVVPVYTTRFWRFSFSDRFDHYPVDEAAVESAVGDACAVLREPVGEYRDILRAVAAETLAAVRSPIPGMPTTWEAFWQIADDARSFGEYGPAGNSFGRKTEFRCGSEERCVLLNGDPLYSEFATDRHAAAVRGSMRAMLRLQRSLPQLELVDAH